MKYRDIAKRYMIEHGAKRPVVAEDGVTFSDEAAKDFTPKQLRKTQEAVDQLKEQLERKWFKE